MPLLLLLAVLLVGCGQTGDLYLPEPAAPAVEKDADEGAEKSKEETP